MSALLIENHSRYLFETSFEYQSTAYHVQSVRMELCKYSMIIYFFLNDECAIVNSIARLSLLDMNWIVCTYLTIISVRNFILGHFDISDNKKGGGETSVFL